MKKLGEIVSIYKSLDNRFYAKLHCDHAQGSVKLDIEEAVQLKIGDKIKVDVEWNEDGIGQRWYIPRPINVLQEQEPKYKELKYENNNCRI